MKKVTIDPSLLGEDKDMLEDLVMAAMNDAVAKAEATTQAKMAGFTAGLNLPPGMGLPLLGGAPMDKPAALEELIQALRCLPGVGPKSAQRMAYHLLQRDTKGAERLADGAARARSSASATARAATPSPKRRCARCALRRGATRSLLCVVETPGRPADDGADRRATPGLYFVLMGRLSPLDGIGPREIHLDRLVRRATDGRCAR